MFGYIDVRPDRLRQIAKQFKKSSPDHELLLSVADSIEAQDEVIDNLASRELEKVQAQMAGMRAELVRASSDASRWRKILGGLAVYGGTLKDEHVWKFRPIATPHQNLNDAIDSI